VRRRAGWAIGAGVWSIAAAVAGLVWSSTGAGFPFGVNDPRGAETGSFFPGAQPGPAGLLTLVIGLLGVAFAVALYRTRGVRVLTGLAALYAVTFLLLVPDIRILQNFAYLFFGYLGLVDAATGWMLAAMVGGVLWAGAAVANLAPRDAPQLTGVREDRSHVASLSWGRPVTIAAAVLALPYPVVRISWALGLPLGMPAEMIKDADLMLRLGETGLGLLAIGGAILTIGLIRPWGRFFPRWVPGLAARPVPVLLAVVPGAWAAVILSAAGLRLWVWTFQEPVNWSTWGGSAPGLFFLPWGLTVAAATYAYWRRSGMESRRT
jgi:hypothetical protein